MAHSYDRDCSKAAGDESLEMDTVPPKGHRMLLLQGVYVPNMKRPLTTIVSMGNIMDIKASCLIFKSSLTVIIIFH